MCVCKPLSLYKEIYYNALAHVIMETGKSNICRTHVPIPVPSLELL